jgi:hypothetical protein
MAAIALRQDVIGKSGRPKREAPTPGSPPLLTTAQNKAREDQHAKRHLAPAEALKLAETDGGGKSAALIRPLPSPPVPARPAASGNGKASAGVQRMSKKKERKLAKQQAVNSTAIKTPTGNPSAATDDGVKPVVPRPNVSSAPPSASSLSAAIRRTEAAKQRLARTTATLHRPAPCTELNRHTPGTPRCSALGPGHLGLSAAKRAMALAEENAGHAQCLTAKLEAKLDLIDAKLLVATQHEVAEITAAAELNVGAEDCSGSVHGLVAEGSSSRVAVANQGLEGAVSGEVHVNNLQAAEGVRAALERAGASSLFVMTERRRHPEYSKWVQRRQLGKDGWFWRSPPRALPPNELYPLAWDTFGSNAVGGKWADTSG